MSDYEDTINSILYAVLLDVKYKPRNETDDEEFEFYDWADDVCLTETIENVVDSYACVGIKRLISFILDCPYSSKDVDAGLYQGVNDWEKMTHIIAYELLRMDVSCRIEDIIKHNRPMLVSGGVIPETNDRQLWFGKDGPVFRCHKILWETTDVEVNKYYDNGIQLTLLFGISIIFEGVRFTETGRDLIELARGGPLCVKPRRIFIVGECKDSIDSLLKFLIERDYMEVANYGKPEDKKVLLSALR